MRLAVLGLLLPATAAAAPLPELYGAPGAGGFTARAGGASPASAYFDPALLPAAGEVFTVDFFTIGSALDVSLRGRSPGNDIDGTINSAWVPDGEGGFEPFRSQSVPTAKLAPRGSAGDDGGLSMTSYVGIGLVKQLLGERLVLGFHAMLPAADLQSQSAFYNDEREQFFSNSLRHEMYGDRLKLATFSFGAGSQIIDELAIGVGFSAGLATAVTTPVFVPDAADYGQVFLDSDLAVSAELAPHFGVVYTPMPALHLSATLHTPSKVEVKGKNIVRVSTMEVELQEFTYVSGYEPLTAGLGAAWTHGALDLATSVTWRQWSAYEDRHGEDPVDGWEDTFNVAVSGGYRIDALHLFAGATFVPSPVPDQVGRSNYVDSTRLGASAGLAFVTSLWGQELRGSLSLQAHALLERATTKDLDAPDPVVDEFPDDAVNPADTSTPLPGAAGLQTNNPGYPGYTSSGWLFGGGFTLETPF